MTATPGARASDIAAVVGLEELEVQRWIDLGLLIPEPGAPEAVWSRARLLGTAVRRGIDASAIAAACEHDPGLLERFDQIVRPPSGNTRSIDEAAREVGLDPAFARRLRTTSGLGSQDVGDDDLDVLRAARVALDVGLPPEALLQLVRVFADSLGRVADAEIRLFHFYVHERLLAEGGTAAEVGAATDAATEALVSLLEPSIAYFHRKAWEAALQEDLLAHFAAEVSTPGRPLNQLALAVLFVDLAGFTPLTEAMGDVAAIEVIDRFSDMVREHAAASEGRVVKQIGDEFMLVFPAATSAIRFALRLALHAAGEARFPALRMGAHFGNALYREADYLGATVNIAARVTGVSGPGELTITEAFRAALGDTSLAFESIGVRPLKGLAEEIELHRAALGQRAQGRSDPVCGMWLATEGVHRIVTAGGAVFEFCSEACRGRFDADPARYGAPDDSAP